MKMDGPSPDQSSPLSESTGGVWGNAWDNEDNSISGLNIENSNELQQLVEDKDIAARAVAFVVNSSRKGIVPLCADVANLMRSKKHLESKVNHLKSQNESLRSSHPGSIRTSHSTSPPPSISCYSDRGSAHTSHPMQDRSRPCSRCSSLCSSLVSNSPKVHHKRSPRLHHTSAFTVHDPSKNANKSQLTTTAVHSPAMLPNGIQADIIAHSSPNEEVTKLRGHQRKNSLPEMVCVPQGIVAKVNPQATKVHKEVQCQLEMVKPPDPALEEQFRETLRINSQLAEELGAAKKEIEVLTGRLRELEMNQLARQFMEKFHIEDECRDGGHESHHVNTPDSSYTRKKSQRLMSMGIGAHVVIRGERTGHIKYIGHLDVVGQPNAVFVGLELDAPVGRHDGSVKGKRYFSCRKDHGIFIPLQDVLCVISKQPSGGLKSKTPSSDKLLNHNTGKVYTSAEGNLKLPIKLDESGGELV